MRPVPLLLAGLTAAASLGAAVLLYQRFGGAEVGYGVRAYVVESDTAVRLDFEVDKDADRSALCTIRARAASGEETGTALVRVGPAPQRSVRLSRTLTTRERAATAEVTGCSLEAASAPAP